MKLFNTIDKMLRCSSLQRQNHRKYRYLRKVNATPLPLDIKYPKTSCHAINIIQSLHQSR